MTDGYISDRELKCSGCYIRNSCDLHPSTCNKQLHVFDAEGLKIHDAKVRADAIEETCKQISERVEYWDSCAKAMEKGSNEYKIFISLAKNFDELAEQLKEQSE